MATKDQADAWLRAESETRGSWRVQSAEPDRYLATKGGASGVYVAIARFPTFYGLTIGTFQARPELRYFATGRKSFTTFSEAITHIRKAGVDIPDGARF
jgi:hypothetical protein